ncbi:MAG: hypothetical protein J6B91_03660 [Prevotella sp.]|nr:hypothetical protein [Prevotella sp.]
MKRTITLVAAALFCLTATLTACSDSPKQSDPQAGKSKIELSSSQEKELKAFKEDVDRVNKKLPMDMGKGLTLIRTELKNGFMTNIYTYPKGANIVINEGEKGKENIKRAVGAAAQRLKALNIGIKYIYKEDTSDKADTISITPEEM